MSPPPTRLSDAEISRLAREIARDIRPMHEILATFKLTAEAFDQVADNGFFQMRLAEESQLWNASDPIAVDRRIKTKAATMVEDLLLEVHTLVMDRAQPMQAKVEALKWASRIAGIGENEGKASEGGGVKITINVGRDKIEFDKDRALPARVIDGQVVELTPSTAA